jgi:hypothetical protein
MRKAAWAFAATAVLLGTTRPARSSDVWEIAGDDTPAATTNLLRFGLTQGGHDLAGAPPEVDQDWYRVVAKRGHAVEARVSGGFWRDTLGAPVPTFDVVDDVGAILAAGFHGPEDIDLGDQSIGSTMRFVWGSDGAVFLRVAAPTTGATDGTVYSIEYVDTTLLVPRWNNSATQTTVLVMQNTTNATVLGFIYFQDATGAQLAEASLNVPARGVQVLATSSIAALAGRSGAALIAPVGGQGAITGKAVALETATGFTFDTPFVPVQR